MHHRQPEQRQHHMPLKSWSRLCLPEHEIYKYLCTYILSNEQLLSLGYPVAVDGNAVQIFSNPPSFFRLKHTFDVNAREFVPRRNQGSSDSGQGSTSSSESEEGVADTDYKVKVRQTNQRVCVRCHTIFDVTANSDANCVFHHGKLGKGVFAYSCCGGDNMSPGCTQMNQHVWSGLLGGFNGPFHDFVHTKNRSSFQVYAMDCEMVYTNAGMECARVTVVGVDGGLVYDELVRPKNTVIDYNTRYSGITEEQLNEATKTLEDVQNDLLKFVFSETILIGHSLESDLRVLKMVHKTVVDTAIAFPHFKGLPVRHSLKFLVKTHLGREIQTQGEKGHDSGEDSQACMDLMLWRVLADFEGLIQHYR